MKNTDKYVDFGIKLPNFLLICGKPGVGKTFMANALIEDSERKAFNFDGDGYSIKMIKRIFKKARKEANSIIFIDDLDWLTKEEDCPVYRQLINELNNYENDGVFVIATISNKNNLPKYFLNDISIDIIINLDYPKIEEACEIYKPLFSKKKVDPNFNMQDFCYFAQDLSYSDVKIIYNEAAQLAIYERNKKITMDNLIKAGLLYNHYKIAEEFNESTAYHEAGHAVVNLLLGGDPSYIVLTEDGGYYFQKKPDIKSYKDRQNDYLVTFAGNACEELFMGESAIGGYIDLGEVSKNIELDNKLLACQGFEYYDSTELDSPAFNDTLAKKVQSDMQSYYDKARKMLEKNKPVVIALVKALKKKNYLLRSEILSIFNKYLKDSA